MAKCRELSSSDDHLLTFDTGCRGFTPLHYAFVAVQVAPDESRQVGLDVVRLLLQESDNPPKIGWYRGVEEGFSMLQQSTDPFYYQRPLADRAEVAFKLIRSSTNSELALMQIALGESITSAQAASLVDNSGRTTLHTVAFTLATGTSSMTYGRFCGGDKWEAQSYRIRDGKDITRTLENELLTP